jgi:iron complex outermembrane receptor protein
MYDIPKLPLRKWWQSPRIYSDASFSYARRIQNTEFSIGSRVMYDMGYRKRNDERIARMNFKLKQNGTKHTGLSYGLGFLGGYNIKTDFILWENAQEGALIQNEATAIELNGLFLNVDPFISFERNSHTVHDLKTRLQLSDNRYFDNPANNSKALSNYAEYQFRTRFFKTLNAIFGLSNLYNRINSRFYGDHQGTNVSFYTQLEYGMLKRIKLSLGVRTEYNESDGRTDNIVPIFRSGINYKAGRSTFLRASFGQGYRYPSVAEKFAYTNLGEVKIFPNPEIKSEFGWSSEIGLKQGIRTRTITGQFDLSAFWSQNKDMIEYVFGLFYDPFTERFDFGFMSSNIENSSVYGAELEFMLTAKLGGTGLDLGGGYTRLYPYEKSDPANTGTKTHLKYRRKNSAKLFFNTRFKKFELSVNCFYKSEVLNIDYVFLSPLTRERLLPGFYDYWQANNKAFLLADIYLSYKVTDAIRISIAVKNVGNTEYMDRPGNIMPHRSYGLQVSGRL